MDDNTPLEDIANEKPSGEATDLDLSEDESQATTNQQESEGSEEQSTDETGQNSENSEAKAQDTNKSNGELTDEERKARNKEFAQARIAAKQRAEAENRTFLENLRSGLEERLGELDESKYEQIAEEEGERLAEIQRKQDELQLRDQERELQATLANIEYQRNYIGMNIAQAESKIPLFNENSDQYDEELHKEALSDWASANLDTFTDNQDNVQILGLKEGAISPEEYLTERAKSYERIMSKASLRGQAEAQKNLNSAELMSSSGYRKSDPDFEGWDDDDDW